MNDIITINADTSIQTTGINEALFERWIKYIDGTPKTVQTYTRAIRQFMNYLQAHGISNPCREDVIAFRDTLAADHKANTVNLYLMSVKQFFKWAQAEGIYNDIAAHIKPIRQDRTFKKDNLTSKQAAGVLSGIDRDTLQGKRDYAIISLMICTGLRTVEVCRADIGDIRTVGDFTALFIQGKGHGAKDNFVKLPAQVESAIRAYLTCRGKADDTEPLFASIAHRNAGERMTTRSISRIAKEAMIDAGINDDRHTAHSLRHTAGTLALLNGSTVQETMQLLRHKDISTTMIYAHNIERADNRSEERIAAAIFA